MTRRMKRIVPANRRLKDMTARELAALIHAVLNARTPQVRLVRMPDISELLGAGIAHVQLDLGSPDGQDPAGPATEPPPDGFKH